jgi:hypothetical protein
MSYDFTYPQGTDHVITVTLNGSNSLPIDLTGYTAVGQARQEYNSVSPTFSFVISILNQIDNPGQFTIKINNNAITTILSKSLNLVYDVEIVDSSLNRTRILEGRILVTPEVTR